MVATSTQLSSVEEKVLAILSELGEGEWARPAAVADVIPYGEFWKTMDGLRWRGLVDRSIPGQRTPWTRFRIGRKL